MVFTKFIAPQSIKNKNPFLEISNLLLQHFLSSPYGKF